MDTKLPKSQPGVVENPNGGYHIHIQLDEREPDTTRNQLLDPCLAMPPSTPALVEMSVFENCVLFTLQDSEDIVIHIDDPRAFDARLARKRSRPARPSWQTRPTFWATAGWQGAVVYVPLGLVWRIQDWQHSSLPELQVTTPSEEQTERLRQARPADVQQLLAVREQCEKKGTYQIGGLNVLLSYMERIVPASHLHWQEQECRYQAVGDCQNWVYRRCSK